MTTQTHTTHSACSMTPQFLQRLRDIVGGQRVLDAPDELVVYECDGYVIEKNAPDVVLFPQTADEVQRIVRECLRFRIP
ncbi:MAG: FAD-binding oxidoreductase, partial [Planctomyces sp.]